MGVVLHQGNGAQEHTLETHRRKITQKEQIKDLDCREWEADKPI
jgi:hypothetical protein